jgi:hypothetical protein
MVGGDPPQGSLTSDPGGGHICFRLMVICHSNGGPAPVPMVNYDQAQTFGGPRVENPGGGPPTISIVDCDQTKKMGGPKCLGGSNLGQGKNTDFYVYA